MAIGPFSPANFLIGFIIAFVTLRLCIPKEMGGAYYHKGGRIALFCLYVLVELVLANIKMAYYTLSPLGKLKPGVLAVPLVEDITDTELTILANLITLTPGTLSLDVSADRSILFIHFMHVTDPDQMRQEIKDGFERRLLEVTR